MSTFKESLLVPVSFLIQKKKKKETKITPSEILNDKTIPADLRLKYYNKFLKYNKERPKSPLKVITKTEAEEEKVSDYEIQAILRDVPDLKIPLARAILQFIKDNDDISWNKKFEVVIDGKTIEDSDIRAIIRFLVGLKIITSEKDFPKGGRETFAKLEVLDIPSDWLTFVQREIQRSRRKRKLEIKGEGQKWIVF